ncbi:protein of unknown function (plasmid) [Caballeronia sp. S22]
MDHRSELPYEATAGRTAGHGTARRAARDKTETDFAIHYLADLCPADGDTCRTGILYLA